MGESFDHCPPGWIRQGGKRCAQFIHNHMVVDCRSMSSVKFGRGGPSLHGTIPSPLQTVQRRGASVLYLPAINSPG